MIEINKTKTTSEFSKSVEIPTNITFSFIVNEINKKFLIIKGRYYAEKIYVGIPSFISFYSKNRFLTFYSSLNKQDKMAIFENFIYKLNSAVKSVRKKFKKVVILKGMGLKLNYNKVLERLELKLGYSHMVNVDLNNEKKKIFLKTSKNTLIVWGGKTQVGNFIDKLKKLKKQSAYKEKGFFFLDAKIVLKKVKKA